MVGAVPLITHLQRVATSRIPGRPLEHAREVELFRPNLGELKRAAKAFRRCAMVMEPPVQLADHRMKQVMRFQPLPLVHGSDRVESRAGAVQIRDGHCPIQRHDRRRLEPAQFVVVMKNARPIRRSGIGGAAMTRRDAGLKMIRRQLVALRGFGQMNQTALDQTLIPLGAILIVETQQIAVLIQTSRKARACQKHGACAQSALRF